MDFLLTQTMNGISFGAILFLLASGLSLIFGVMKIVNIAHGSYYMFGGYVGLSVMVRTGNFFLAILAGTITLAVIGLAMERIFLRKFYLKDMPQMLLTMGFALIIRDVCFVIWGGDPYTFPAPKFLEGSMQLGNITFPVFRIFAVFVAVAMAVLLEIFYERTSLGAKLRACVDDNEMAGAVGICVPLVSGVMFGLGAALAALGGVIGGPFFGIYPGLDFDMLPVLFVVVIIGGLGSLKGAAAGSIMIGIIDTFGKALVPDLSYFTLFAPMALVMAVRPTGLFGGGKQLGRG